MVKEKTRVVVSLSGPDLTPTVITSAVTDPSSDAGPSVPPRSSQHPSLTSFSTSTPPQQPPTKHEPQDDRSSVRGGFLDKNFRPAVAATSPYHVPPAYGDRQLAPLKARHAVTPYPVPLYYYTPLVGLAASVPHYPPPPILAPRRLSGSTPSTVLVAPPQVQARPRSKANSPNLPTSSSPRAQLQTPGSGSSGSGGSTADADGDPDELYDDELENVQSADLDGEALPDTVAPAADGNNPHPRPPYSACMMIRQVLIWSPQGKLRSSLLCDAIAEKYPYFQEPIAKKHLRDSVRHKLSNRPQFRCLPKEPGDKGKGGYWEYVFKDGSTSSTISWEERQRRMEEGTRKRQMKMAQERGGVVYVNENPAKTTTTATPP